MRPLRALVFPNKGFGKTSDNAELFLDEGQMYGVNGHIEIMIPFSGTGIEAPGERAACLADDGLVDNVLDRKDHLGPIRGVVDTAVGFHNHRVTAFLHDAN